jgi:uncharacterized RDD family membrane protein YckC
MVDERRYSVETPEQIDLVYDIAGIGSRFLAALIDHVLISMILSLGCVAVALLADQLALGLDTTLVFGIFGIGIYLFLCAYYIFFETTWNGQTPGKRVIGIRVVRVGGRPIGFLGSSIRNFVRLADFLPVLYGIGVGVMFIDRQSRRLGDLAAGALTVKEGRQVTLQMLTTPQAQEAPVVADATAITIPNLTALQADDYRLVQAYLRRRTSLGQSARQEIAKLLVQGLQTRLGYAIQGDQDTFLLQLAAEYQLLQREPQPVPEDNTSVVEGLRTGGDPLEIG